MRTFPFLIIAAILVGCQTDPQVEISDEVVENADALILEPDPAPETEPESPTTPQEDSEPYSYRSGAVDKMVAVYQGGHSYDSIKDRMDTTMNLYDLAVIERNYERAASALIELRKSTGVSEMDLLTCMIESKTPGVGMDFPSAAALCATMMG